MPTPSSTAWSITPTGLTSTGKACGEPVNPAERPEPVALWTCRCAWTTQERCPHAHSRSSRKTSPPSRDSRLTTWLCRCQKPDSQNASRPGRHQIGMVGEIISESWARSNRYTRARSSESAVTKAALLNRERMSRKDAGNAQLIAAFVRHRAEIEHLALAKLQRDGDADRGVVVITEDLNP